MGFSFSNIGDWLDQGVDFVLDVFDGEDDSSSFFDYESDAYGVDSSSWWKTAAKEGIGFLADTMEDKDEKNRFQSVKRTAPEITRYGQERVRGGLADLRNPVGLSNPDIQSAIRRFSERTHGNRDMARLANDVAVRRTLAQGRKTVTTPTPQLPKAKKVAPATVRKEAKDG
tara:strand:+ start:810 stop:1322 length:513 start_codon:yes stop_codon:yes gene_type:complete